VRSGGTYDYRGLASIEALADVVRFAAGTKQATVDRTGAQVTLASLVPFPVHASNIGLLAVSNGGNLAGVTMSLKGGEMPPVAWYVGWETPAGDQFIGSELSDSVTGANPYYVTNSCVDDTCTVDYTRLAIDTSVPYEAPDVAARDGGESVALPGTVYFDSASTPNGRYDMSSDFALKPRAVRLQPGGPLKVVFSMELTGALHSKGLISGAIATVAEAEAFWAVRDVGANGHYARAIARNPNPAVMVIASEKDYVQNTPDHPHIKLQLDGWRAAGARFVRLNPDRAYVEQVGGRTTI
jgi:hypothetical protein